MKRKAQGLPLNVIIIAALALIVLIVLIVIFTGRAGIFTRTLASCKDKGGFCCEGVSLTNFEECNCNVGGTGCAEMTCDGKRFISVGGTDCKDSCCIRIGGEK